MKRFKQYLTEDSFKLNVATVPLKKARGYAEIQFKKAGKSLDDIIPDFDKNYQALAKVTKSAPDIPRIDMPVIEPRDIQRFEKDLKGGNLDIFKPLTFKHEFFPKDLLGKRDKSSEFLQLGQKDGDKTDDIIKVKMTSLPGKSLKPTQSEIWLEELIANIVKFGVPSSGSPITKATIITSKSGFILDGHHRYGQVMLGKPSLGMKVLKVPLDIKTLLKVGRSYGNAIGHNQKQ